MVDFEQMRASDAERFAIVSRLQEAAAEGRLSLGEFSYRASRAYDAQTWRELDRLVQDIPPKFRPALRAAAEPVGTLPFVVLMLGVLSIPCALLGSVMGLLVGAVGMVLGVLALYRADGNRGMALAGTLLSMLATVLLVAVPVMFGALSG